MAKARKKTAKKKTKKKAAKKKVVKTRKKRKKNTKKDKGGRPPKYQSKFAKQAFKLCLLGVTDKEMASFFGVALSTISKWKKDHPRFSERIFDGKLKADSEVAHSLYKRAIGCSVKVAHVSNYEGDITTTDIKKYYPPDAVAAFRWLQSRTKHFSEKIEHGVSGELKELLEVIDGSSKGKLPKKQEATDVR